MPPGAPPIAFINMLYSPSYERVYLAFIAGLAGFGMVPTAAVHDPSSSFQLERIFDLIAASQYSFHDLSSMGVSGNPPTPQFNMPFELGLAIAAHRVKKNGHQWFVFDTRQHRLSKAMSDLAGVLPKIHAKTPDSVLRALLNALDRQPRRPTFSQLMTIYRELSKFGKELKRTDGYRSLFDTHPFSELAFCAATVATSVIK